MAAEDRSSVRVLMESSSEEASEGVELRCLRGI